MDKIEKIRAEIERRMKIYKESNYGISLRYQELEELLSFLDTLSEEPDKSLEEAAKGSFVVGNYVVHDGRIELGGDPLPSLDPILLLPYPQFKPGDKVRIIIVKED